MSSVVNSLAQTLRLRGAEHWRAAVEHPMVRAIGDGTLAHETFRFYLAQNILYLEEYAKAIGLSTALTCDREALGVLARFLSQIVENELPANLEFLRRVGGEPLVGGSRAMTSVTYDYTRHLLVTSREGPLARSLVALLPCQWSYGEIGTRLARSTPADDLYADWIATFANPDYDDLVGASSELLERVAPPGEVEGLADLFDRSVGYEVAFWQMAYTRDTSVPSNTNQPSQESHHV